MKRTAMTLAAAVALSIGAASSAKAMDCGAVIDELTKAISGHLTMSPERKAAMLRMTMSAYDRCMSGDKTSAEQTRAMLMEQLRQSLGGR